LPLALLGASSRGVATAIGSSRGVRRRPPPSAKPIESFRGRASPRCSSEAENWSARP